MMEHIIGIDLGTTNSTLASVGLMNEEFRITQHAIPQIDADGEERPLSHLPSLLLFPLEKERNEKFVVGQYAKERGQELPKRLIGSAKSWLSCLGIDRREPFLPHADQEAGIEKLSPIEVSAAFLRTLRRAWEISAPKTLFEKQQVIVTVPASFDPSARALVIEAAKQAQFPPITLIEEPLAAFYAWLGLHEKNWRQQLKIGDRVLIVDIGGGTTDFTLVTVNDKRGDLALERSAVGSHLLLGGDNIDLALAHYTKAKLEKENHSLDRWQFHSLIMQARKAKEILFGDEAPQKAPLFIESKGSSLIGRSIRYELSRGEVQELLLNGFFPLIPFEEQVEEQRLSAIAKFGLPYAKDARITAHLANFFNESCHGTLPTKVLFNGGTMKSPSFQKRILEQLNLWAEKQKAPYIEILEGADFDFAVSKGAVYFGWTKEKHGIRVKTGTSRNYFLGIEGAAPAVPGIPSPFQALCIVPFGMEEGSEVFLSETFTLIIGEQVQFRFFSSCSPNLSDGSPLVVGSVVEDIEELTELHPVEVYLNNEGVEGKMVQVKLHAKVTEMGMLELWCEAENDKQWKLEFNLRQEELPCMIT